MRKAFDANVSRAKPRLRLGALTSAPIAEPDEGAPESGQLESREPELASGLSEVALVEEAPEHSEQPPRELPRAEPEPLRAPEPAAPRRARAGAEVTASLRQAPKKEPPAPEALDPKARRERLKERLKAATAQVSVAEPTPATPGEAKASALALVADLRQKLESAEQLNVALSKDLEEARAQMTRAVEEAKVRTAEATRMVQEVAERARLIEELGRELSSLEEERDDALVELRAARARTEETLAERDKLEEKLTAAQAELSETLAEEERIAGELEARNAELRAAQAGVTALTAERDQLAKQLAEMGRERAALTESQRALDEIHRALAEARSRVGVRPS